MATLRVVAGSLAINILLLSSAEGATREVASCDAGQVQDAISAARSGDVIHVPAGDCTWATAVRVPAGKNVILRGAGIDGTTIRSAPASAAIWITSSASRVTGFTFACGHIGIDGEGWRIDHNKFTCQSFVDGVLVRGLRSIGTPTGLVDHNTFLNQRVLVQGYPGVSLTELNGTTQWSDPLGLGTISAVYVEDNNFLFTVFGNAVDCNYGGRYVFRHNAVTDAYLEAHSVQATNRGCRKWEIYENTLSQVHRQVYRAMFLRGGTGVVFNNTMIGTFGVAQNLVVDNVRSYQAAAVFGRCDGTSIWDGNTTGENGWPCRDQIGRGGDVSMMTRTLGYIVQHLEPAYFWGNIFNGRVGGVQVDNGAGLHIRADRDYFANRGPKPGYAPFTYPHPLALSTPPAPRRLRLVQPL